MLEVDFEHVEAGIKVYNFIVTDAEFNALVRFVELVVRGANDAIDVVDTLDTLLKLQSAVLPGRQDYRESAGLDSLRPGFILLVVSLMFSLAVAGVLIFYLFNLDLRRLFA